MKTKTLNELFEIGVGEGPEDMLAIKEVTHRVQKAFNSLEVVTVPDERGNPTIEFWVNGTCYPERSMPEVDLDDPAKMKLGGVIMTLLEQGLTQAVFLDLAKELD